MCMNVDWLIDVATGERHVSWDGVPLPGLHKKGQEISLIISFGEFLRGGKRVFTGFAKLRAEAPGYFGGGPICIFVITLICRRDDWLGLSVVALYHPTFD